MDWERSYTASWRVFRVNRKTWADGELIKNVDSASVTRTVDGDLMESGSIKITGDFEPDYYRIVMTAEQDADVVRVDVATLLFDISGGSINYGRTERTADGYSVLYPASKTTVLTGEYAPAGVNGAEYAANLLRSAISAPVEVEGSFTLSEHIVHEIGSSIIEAVWSVLNAGNFVIQIDGRGIVHIRPMPTEPALVLDSARMRMLANEIQFTSDISDIPNRYIVISDDLRTVAVNNDPTSSVSTVSRGYCIDYVDDSPTLVNSETQSEYAVRKLHEMSVMQDERSYTREYAPDVYPYSIIRASIDGLEGDLRVQSQSIKCDYGITISEKSVREVSMW